VHTDLIYLPQATKKMFIQQIDNVFSVFKNKIFPVFLDIEKDADEHRDKKFYEIGLTCFEDSIDECTASEKAQEAGFEYYELLSAGRRNLLLSWHMMLYHFWEQQVREYLCREMEHTYTFNVSNFCTSISDIKKIFLMYCLNIEKLDGWNKINELNLICNAIKHGDGPSLRKLFELNPNLFSKYIYKYDLLNPLHNNALELSLETLDYYKNSLIDFWEQIPERSYLKVV
jgi:hypothetical protein